MEKMELQTVATSDDRCELDADGLRRDQLPELDDYLWGMIYFGRTGRIYIPAEDTSD